MSLLITISLRLFSRIGLLFHAHSRSIQTEFTLPHLRNWRLLLFILNQNGLAASSFNFLYFLLTIIRLLLDILKRFLYVYAFDSSHQVSVLLPQTKHIAENGLLGFLQFMLAINSLNGFLQTELRQILLVLNFVLLIFRH